MNSIQKILRPMINLAVETFFPEGAFYGENYLRDLRSDSADLTAKWGSVEMACMMFVTTSLREQGATKATFEATDVTHEGVPMGSWKVTVEGEGNHE